ncbi:response regulator receiver protein [Megasphaera cerevisiae DSM 20462]|uniref:Response regulator receiver protein n=2 Tax=Megasphaera TaxID=906 RepID=A0A0J6WRN4_9FIRM|nr:response regulator receiver protein [Megasphaera cerevisiae DSM 20462]SKA04869.1 two component transcriptional regulator, LytTR family [Megasphaera cerevisiae DSM 20462]
MPMKAFIIDHEPLMAAQLKKILLRISSSVSEISICYEGEQALTQVMQFKPDIIFLTIEMPRFDGISIARRLYADMEKLPVIVLVTGSRELVIQAVQLNALDYLVKPIQEQDVRRVWDKFLKLHPQPVAASGGEPTESSVKNGAKGIARDKPYSKKFSVNEGDKIKIIDSAKIRLVYAEKRKVFVVTTDGGIHQSRLNLVHFEQRLPEIKFFRCHRNYIVNIDEVQEIEPWFNHQYLLILKGNPPQQVPIGRSYVSKIRDYIEL